MKKFKLKFVLPLVALVALCLGGFTAFSTSTASESDLLLANVEALANGEVIGGCFMKWGRKCKNPSIWDHMILRCDNYRTATSCSSEQAKRTGCDC